MSLGPYRYVNGKRYTFGEDGRWWHVNYSSGGDDYGKPVPASEVTPYAVHHHAGHHSRHHGAHHASHATLAQAHASPIRKPNGTGAPTPSADPWQGNNYARELFQGQGAKYFLGADHLVTRLTQAAAVAYTAAFFAPELVASSQFLIRAYRVGPLGNTIGRVFWSGGYMIAGLKAAEVAIADDGTTLELTPVGQWLDSVAPNATWLWKLASAQFARGAAGPVLSVQGDAVDWKSVWATIEYGILVGKNEIVFYSATGKW